MDTDSLIAELSGSVRPVSPLRPAWQRTALWLALGLPPLVLVIAIHGLEVSPATLMGDRLLWIEEIAALATAITAAMAAFASTVPGGNRKWLWLPVIPLSVWLLTIGKGCYDDWLQLGPEALSLRLDTGCAIPMVAIGLVPTIAMVTMLRHGAPISPRISLVLGALATAAIVNFGLRLFHAGDVTIMVLVWHFGFIAAVALIACFVAPRILAWHHQFRGYPANG